MELFLFLTMIIILMVYVHLFLPKKIVKPEWVSPRRVRFDLFFLEGTVLLALLLLKPDAFGPLMEWQKLFQEDILLLTTHLLSAYLILSLYALPGFAAIALFYRFERWTEQRVMGHIE